MYRLGSMLATAALLLSANPSGVLCAPWPEQSAGQTAGDNLPSLPKAHPGDDQEKPAPAASIETPPADNANAPAKSQAGPLKAESRLSLVRYVDGEIVQVVRAIPVGKKGFHLKAGAPFNETALRMAVATASSAINPGDRAQITNLDFKDKEIVIDINGGGKGKTRLRDRIHLEVGGMPTATTTQEAPVNTNAGATIYLEFDKPLPDMTAEELEQYLSGVLDFSKRHSAAVQWVETLPPEIQQAIQDKKPIVGMDHDMVLAAMGRPDRKVREKGTDGSEIEDWIYGTPPAKTIFVSFEGDKVTQVHQYPQ
ncbi:MAG TPA: hypothetical protein VH161_05800 [Candidatus Acidoferrales bacterium]|jgi:hypothetical protein|nr:hypothetical protein [Candidatus Acidoferrales bacterium]